ncbi:MAG: hypothetical protein ACTSVY_11515 [Candidatus Helarchaeota archaeon]
MNWFKILDLIMDEIAKMVVIGANLRGEIMIKSPDKKVHAILLETHGKAFTCKSNLPN